MRIGQGLRSNIQCIPTPEMFQREEGQRFDLDNVGPQTFALVSCISIVPVVGTPQTDESRQGLALDSCIVTGAQLRSVTDTGNQGLALQSCVSLLPITQSQTDTANGGYALDSVLLLTPVSRTVADDSNQGFALQSCVL